MKRLVAAIAGISVLLGGCAGTGGDSSGGNARPVPEGGKTPKRATLYVEAKGEPVNTAGKKAEKIDSEGKSAGEFKPGDLLLPGMTLLVSAGTAVGGTWLVKALDKGSRSEDGPTLVGVDEEGTGLMTVDVPPEVSSSAPVPGGEAPPAEVPIDPGGVILTAGSGPEVTSTTVAKGKGVVSSLSSVVLEMGYTAAHTGPTWIDMTFTSAGSFVHKSTTYYTFTWELVVDTTEVARGTTVDVYATITGVPAGAVVWVMLWSPASAEFTADRPSLVRRPPREAGEPVGTSWHAWRRGNSLQGYEHYFVFRSTGEPGPHRLGQLVVHEDVTIRLIPETGH